LGETETDALFLLLRLVHLVQRLVVNLDELVAGLGRSREEVEVEGRETESEGDGKGQGEAGEEAEEGVGGAGASALNAMTNWRGVRRIMVER
jgi:hypothetical protein